MNDNSRFELTVQCLAQICKQVLKCSDYVEKNVVSLQIHLCKSGTILYAADLLNS